MEKKNTKRISSTAFVGQAAILAASGIGVRLLGFLYRLPLTDLIGDEGNGIYGIGFSVYNFFLILSSAGLPAAISKLVSEKRAAGLHHVAHRIFVVAFVMAAIIGAVFMLLIFIFAPQITTRLGTPQAYLVLRTLSPTVFIVAMMAVIRGYFQGSMSMVPTAVSQIIEQLFNAAFSIILAHALWNHAIAAGRDHVVYGAAGGTSGNGIGALAGFLVIAGLYFLARPQFLKEVRRSRALAKRNKNRTNLSSAQIARSIFLTSFPIIAGTAVFSIANLIDTWLVPGRLMDAGFSGDEALELFGQLTGKFNPITNLPAAISSSLALALIPSIAASKELGKYSEISQKLNIAMRTSMLLCVPIAFGLGALGPQITALLFPSHPEGGTLFIWGFLSIILLCMTHIATGVLQAIGKIYIPVYAAILGAIVKIISGYILLAIPSINIYGAIIGTTLCYLVTTIINCGYLYRYTYTKLDFKGIIIKPVLASLVMVLGIYSVYNLTNMLLSDSTIATILSILAGMVVYGIFMMLIRGIKATDVVVLPKGKRLAAALRRRGYL